MTVFKKYKWTFIGIGALFTIALALWIFNHSREVHSTYVVRRTNFEKYIETKGEIHGKNALFITLDDIFKDNDLRLSGLRIKDMVPEGTIVKKGDWVATLDQASITQRIQENRDELERRLAFLNDARIDSTITLTNMRQRINELQYDLQYNELDLQQAKYESPAYQRRIQTAYNQRVRQIDRAKRDYELRRLDLSNRLRRFEERYNTVAEIDKKLQLAMEASNIASPQAGMVIYARVRGNRKIRVGDEVGPWRPEIASIPDLSVLVSETYVEEIDISKISVGDSVQITIDALPGERYRGNIIQIANVGQELAGFESKVFAVTVELADANSKLLPGMTSTNQIIQERIPQQLIIPKSSLFTDGNRSYVYLKKSGKIWKQLVETGTENNEFIVVSNGLEEKDRILISAPANSESLAFLN
ncbi:MAG: efflux RND transporter periplasmic adaptor subunit [Bacteroidota bacterium]